jgi:hypothetical protein
MFCAQIVGKPLRVPEPAVNPANTEAPCSNLRRVGALAELISDIVLPSA